MYISVKRFWSHVEIVLYSVQMKMIIILFHSFLSVCGTTSENVEDFVICLKDEVVSDIMY